MSVEYTIFCNGCGEVIEASRVSANVARNTVRDMGGRTSLPGGKDLCPACVTAGKVPE